MTDLEYDGQYSYSRKGACVIRPTHRAKGVRAWDSLSGPTLWCRNHVHRASRWYITADARSAACSVTVHLTRATARIVLTVIVAEREAASAEAQLLGAKP